MHLIENKIKKKKKKKRCRVKSTKHEGYDPSFPVFWQAGNYLFCMSDSSAKIITQQG